MIQLENKINPRKIALLLGIVSVYLAAQSLIGEYYLENVLSSDSDSTLTSVIDLFSVNLEASIPTWYATVLLFVSAALLALIAAVKQKNQEVYARHWMGLSIIFWYLSVDEGAAIHEMIGDPLEAALNPTGYLTFAWLIVFVPLVIIFALLYLRFLFHLPSRIRNYVILAGILYVGGAVVVEAMSANRWYLDGGVSYPYLVTATVEELCEMLGIVVFIFALLLYAGEAGYTAVIQFSPDVRTGQETTNQMVKKAFHSWKWAIRFGLVAIIGFNAALGLAAYRRQSVPALNDSPSATVYAEISERYAGQGVIILQINEVVAPDNLAAQQYATSLLTLFNDVLIVTFPHEQLSIAFAGHDLPFDQNTLSQILLQGGNDQSTILDTAAVRAIAEHVSQIRQ